MEAKQAKRKQMVSNPIVGTAKGVETSNHFITQSNDGYDPFRPGSSSLKTRVSNTFSSQVIPNNQYEHTAFMKNVPTDGSTNSKAQAVLTPSGAKVITYQVIKDKGNVSNVVFGMSGDSWNPQPQERSKLKRVVDQPKDHGQTALFGDNGVELRSDKYLHEKPQFQPNYQQLHSKQRAYEHLHGATPDVSQINRKGDELMSHNTNWHNHSLPAKKVNQHFNQYQNTADRKIKEQISTAFGQHERPEFQSSSNKISKTLLSTNAGWANSDTQVKKANNPENNQSINLKEKKYSQLQSSVFNTDNGSNSRPATSACNLSLHRENQLINNANDEKRKLNHLYSEINGRELGAQKNNLRDNAKENQKARGGNDFCTNSDWKNIQGQLLRKGKGDYSEQVMKNDSSAMGACLPLTRYENGSGVDTKAIGFALRKHDQHGNDIHQVDNFQKEKPKIVKQLHLKSNMHRKDFYQNADVQSNQQVYEFSVDNLPADTYDNDLAKMCKGAHIVKSQVDFDKIMGSCNGHGKLLIRSSPSKIQNAQKQLIERGLKVQACERKDIGKKSNFADLNQVNWMHPHLQKQERRLQNHNLQSHDLMKGQDFYHSDPQIFGGESGRHLNEWKKNLLNSRALKLKNKTEDGRLRESLQSWETVRQSNSNFKNAYNVQTRQNVRATVRSIKLPNKKG